MTYEEFKCPYQEGCPEYHISVQCDTHLHVKCDYYSEEKEVQGFLERIRNHQGLDKEVQDD